jgi:hypothetical protein
MIFEIEPSSNPALRPRGRNKNTIVLLALLPDPLGNNPSDAAIERYAEGVERALARVAPGGERPTAPGAVRRRFLARMPLAALAAAQQKRRPRL